MLKWYHLIIIYTSSQNSGEKEFWVSVALLGIDWTIRRARLKRPLRTGSTGPFSDFSIFVYLKTALNAIFKHSLKSHEETLDKSILINYETEDYYEQ